MKRKELCRKLREAQAVNNRLIRSQRRLIATLAEPDLDYRSTLCGTKGCPCSKPGAICNEWMGLDEDREPWCPRCGWHHKHHPKETV